jgi:hypothetical protein
MKRREMLGALGALPLLSLTDLEGPEDLREKGYTGGARKIPSLLAPPTESKKIEGIFLVTIDVGKLPPYKAEIFCDRVKDDFIKERNKSVFKDWMGLFIPTREGNADIEAFPMPENTTGGMLIYQVNVGMLPPFKAEAFCHLMTDLFMRDIEKSAWKNWTFHAFPVRKLPSKVKIYPKPLRKPVQLKPYDEIELRRFAYHINSCSHRAEFNANQKAQRELREIKKKLREFDDIACNMWDIKQFRERFGEYLYE